jgi:hypothetical protein
MFGLMNCIVVHKQTLTMWFLFNCSSLIGGKRRGPLGNTLKENIKEFPLGQFCSFETLTHRLGADGFVCSKVAVAS